MKQIITALLFFICLFDADAQQIVMVNHYFNNPVVYNPAFAGSSGCTNVVLVNHTQWSGFKGAPRYNMFSLDKSFNKTGLGVNLVSDKKGLNNKLGGSILYSYRININDNTRLLLGIAAGVFQQSLNYSSAITESATDATIFSGDQNKITYDGNAGFAFLWKQLEVSAVALQLSGNKINYSDNNSNSISYRYARHYIGSAKYKFIISKDKNIVLSPQGLVRFVPNAPLQYDGNINLEWIDKFWIGATYKSDYAASANVGFCIRRQLYIGYSYDIMMGEIGKYSGISHEIMVNIQLGKNKKPKMISVSDGSAQAEIPVPEEPEPEPPAEKEIPETEPAKTEIPAKDLSAYEKNWDSLETKLNEKFLKENREILNDKPAPPVNVQVKKEIISSVPKSENAVTETHTSKINNGVGMATNRAVDFKNDVNETPLKGYYIVAGSFHNRNFAVAEVKRLSALNYNEANWIYFMPTNFNYVFIKKAASKKEAIRFANEAKASGIMEVWIQRIIE